MTELLSSVDWLFLFKLACVFAFTAVVCWGVNHMNRGIATTLVLERQGARGSAPTASKLDAEAPST